MKEKNEEKEKNNLEMFSMLKEIKEQMKIMASDISEMKKKIFGNEKKDGFRKKRRRGNSDNEDENEDKDGNQKKNN